MTNHDTGGTLNGWDDELNDWTEDDHVTASQATERLHDLAFAGNKCIRPKPGEQYPNCAQGYEHVGACDWFDAAYDDALAERLATHDRAQQAYNAVTDRGYCDEAP